MKIQRIVTLLCTAALLLCAASPPALAADRSAACYYPVEVESYTAGDFDQPRVRKVYQLSRSDDPAGIPTEDFEEYGRTFHLMEMTRKDEIGVETQPLTKTVTTDSATGDLGEILKQLAPEIEAETEDGYAGMLKLDYNSVQVEVKGYKTSTRNLSASRTYPNLSDADLSLVPKTVTEGGRTLTLADVKWSDSTNMEGEMTGALYRHRQLYRLRHQPLCHRLHRHSGLHRRGCQNQLRDRDLYRHLRLYGCALSRYENQRAPGQRPDRGGYVSGDAPCAP